MERAMNELRGFFPQHFMFVGLLFYIPEQAQGKCRKSKISNAWRRWKSCYYWYCTPHTVTPTPWFSKNHQNLQNSMKESIIVLCCIPSEPDLRYTKILFPQHFMFVGLLFYIPEQAQGKCRKFKIANPWRRWKRGYYCYNCYCCCTPPTVTPTPRFSQIIKNWKFYEWKCKLSLLHPFRTRFEVQ